MNDSAESPRRCFACGISGIGLQRKSKGGGDVRRMDAEALVAQLNSDDERPRNAALLRVVEITKEGDARSMGLVHAGAIPTLVQLLADEEVPLHINAYVAAALCNLSQEPATHPIFASKGTIKDIVNYVAPSHQVLSGACAIMLGNLMMSPILERQMLETGAASVLVKGLAACTEFEISCAMIDALATLASRKELRADLISALGIEVVAYVLHNLARSHYSQQNVSSPTSPEAGTSQSSIGSGQPVFTVKCMKDPLLGWSPRSLDSEGYNNQLDASALDSCSSEDETPRKVGYILQPNRMPSQVDLQDTYSRQGRLGKKSLTDDKVPEFHTAEMTRVEKLMNLLLALIVDSGESGKRLVVLETGVEVVAYWVKQGNPFIRTAGLRIIRQLLRTGQGGFTCRKDVVEGVAVVLAEDEQVLQDLELDVHMYKRVAVQTAYELCSHGGDSMRVAGAQAGLVLSLLRILDSDPPPRMQHAVLRALHNLCQHSLPRTQLATSGGVPSLLSLVGLGMREAKWVPRQRYDSPVGRQQHVYRGPASPNHQGGSIQQDTAFHIRALEYCSAVLRIVADVQSPEWTDDLLEGGVVPTMLDALNQTASAIVRKQALGTLTSLASIRDSRAPEFIALEGGCSALMNLRVDASQCHVDQIDNSEQWLAWTSLALMNLLDNKHTKRYVLQAARECLDDDSREVSRGMLKQQFAPCVDRVDVEWIVAL
eukprot:evm.model.scf_1334.4 EVM.evm.TU.scf_1334.4   scf_1334:21598-34065(+)